jgi:hypothetical protein
MIRNEGRQRTAPFILVSTHKLKDGQMDNYRDFAEGLSEYVEANEPRLIAFNVYANDRCRKTKETRSTERKIP